jgi:hypothetical protein
MMVKKVAMVYGFSSSPCLRQAVKKILPARIELLLPPYARTAVVRGALIKALADEDPASAKVSVAGRVACKHYGTPISILYNVEEYRGRAQGK